VYRISRSTEIRRVNRLATEHGKRLFESGQLAEGPGPVTVPLPEEAVEPLLRARDFYQAALQTDVEDIRIGALFTSTAGSAG
jgi:hypothetical protein